MQKNNLINTIISGVNSLTTSILATGKAGKLKSKLVEVLQAYKNIQIADLKEVEYKGTLQYRAYVSNFAVGTELNNVLFHNFGITSQTNKGQKKTVHRDGEKSFLILTENEINAIAAKAEELKGVKSTETRPKFNKGGSLWQASASADWQPQAITSSGYLPTLNNSSVNPFHPAGTTLSSVPSTTVQQTSSQVVQMQPFTANHSSTLFTASQPAANNLASTQSSNEHKAILDFLQSIGLANSVQIEPAGQISNLEKTSVKINLATTVKVIFEGPRALERKNLAERFMVALAQRDIDAKPNMLNSDSYGVQTTLTFDEGFITKVAAAIQKEAQSMQQQFLAPQMSQ